VNQYICTFRGRRDNYQIPVALAEAEILDEFITDFYASKFLKTLGKLLPQWWQQKINLRLHPNLPSDRIRCLWGTTVLENFRHILGFSRAATFDRFDRIFSRKAAARARSTKSHLLMYTPYAWEAFQTNYTHKPRKVLFQFHPHADTEFQLLTEDVQRFPCVQASYLEETLKYQKQSQARVRDCWQYADLILCASSFTKSTLLAAGADSNLCHVIPYGVDLPILPIQPQPEGFRALFVGSGIQRKGLHHLLYAWQQAQLPEDSLLTIVCRSIDSGIRELLTRTKSVRLISGVDLEELNQLYATSSLFVMPSLVEGFGQVFLEALSHGCPILGTANTCLPDLGGEREGIFLTEVGNIEQLAAKLEQLATTLPDQSELRQHARSLAARFSWKQFRAQLIALLSE
jgi:glycosyltransferase involved in cell wall biosynthesis